jgi:hypothetical protein
MNCLSLGAFLYLKEDIKCCILEGLSPFGILYAILEIWLLLSMGIIISLIALIALDWL